MKPRQNDGERGDADVALPLRQPQVLRRLRSDNILFVEVVYFPDSFIVEGNLHPHVLKRVWDQYAEIALVENLLRRCVKSEQEPGMKMIDAFGVSLIISYR